MIPQENFLYREVDTNTYIRVFHVMAESRLYFAGRVSLDYKITEWPAEPQTFDYFRSISKNLEIQIKDPMRPKPFSAKPKTIERRDAILKVVKQIVDEHQPQIFFISMRNRLIQNWRDENKNKDGEPQYGRSTIYEYIEKYLASGRQIDCLTPRYEKCGMPGKAKPCTNKKLGRPQIVTNSQLNFVMSEQAKEIIKRYFKKYVKSQGISGAHQTMIAEQFAKKKSVPSFTQFRYWGTKLNDPVAMKKELHGSIIYNKDHRPLHSSSRNYVFGPGSEFMMDSTKDNTALTSVKFFHKYLGRCTIYLIVDVFSGMITGFTVTPDNASYYSAALALYSAGTNKQKLINELALTNLTEADWPCEHMPARILCDRGPEFISYMSESIPNNLDITLNNAPPYRPDLKGIVEAAIKSLLSKIANKIYGVGLIQKGPRRITPDARKEATLNYKDITKIVVLEIIKHNHAPIEDYIRTPEMIEANVPTIPMQLWNWGMSQGLGALRKFDETELWIKLLPSDKFVTLNRKGFNFNGRSWIGANDETEILRERLLAQKVKGQKYTLSYNPTSTNEIFLVHNEQFYQLKHTNTEDFTSLYEVRQEDKTKAAINDSEKNRLREFQNELIQSQQTVIKKAKKEASENKSTRNNQPQRVDITVKEARKQEIEHFHAETNNARGQNENPAPTLTQSPTEKLKRLDRTHLLTP